MIRRITTAVVILLAALLLVQPATAQSPTGTVSAIEGEAEVVRGDERSALVVGTALAEGDTVATAEGTRLAIQMADGTRLIVGGSTELVLRSASGASEPSGAMRLLLGILRATVGPAARDGGGPVVATQTAVASVRSTDWIVEATEGSTGVFVLEGEVLVEDTGGLGAVTVGPGLGTNVAAGEAPTDPAPWGASRIRDVLGRTAPP